MQLLNQPYICWGMQTIIWSKTVLMNVNPPLKSMAKEENAFQQAAPMLFGEEFAKKATVRVEAVKAIKKITYSKSGETYQSFFPIPPRESAEQPQGWFQKWPRGIPVMPEDHSSLQIKHPRTEKQLETCSVHFIIKILFGSLCCRSKEIDSTN